MTPALPRNGPRGCDFHSVLCHLVCPGPGLPGKEGSAPWSVLVLLVLLVLVCLCAVLPLVLVCLCPCFTTSLLFIAACQSHKSKRPCIKEVPLKLSVAVDCSKAVMCVETYSHLSPRGRINNIERDVEKERKEAIA